MNPPNVIVRPPLAELTRVEVVAVGDKVELRVGNSTMTFDYETALRLSQWLRVRGKEAKRFAGDTGRHWSAVAVLDALK